jgi:FKBP-type peptidyl-prolyl cis-trans isomerase (trigger factor)
MFKKEKIKDLHYSVNGLISANDLQAAADEILLEYGKKVKMPGFRTGKVPLNILRQKYNASAYGEAIDKIMNDDLNKYIADKKIRLAGAPKADLAGWEIGKDAEYSLEFDILPTLPEIDLGKITVSGPGQNASAILRAWGVTSCTIASKASISAICTISGLSEGLPFASYIFLEESLFKASPPRP